MKGGAVDFLTKPVDETVLLAAVEQTLQKDRGARLEAFEQADLLARYRSLTRKMKADSFAMLVKLATKLSPEQSVAPGRDN